MLYSHERTSSPPKNLLNMYHRAIRCHILGTNLKSRTNQRFPTGLIHKAKDVLWIALFRIQFERILLMWIQLISQLWGQCFTLHTTAILLMMLTNDTDCSESSQNPSVATASGGYHRHLVREMSTLGCHYVRFFLFYVIYC